MHFFACLRLERFFVGCLIRTNPELKFSSLVVTRKGTVLDADELSRTRGVREGMPEKQARAILEGTTFMEWEADPYREASNGWLDLLTPYSDVIEPVDQHKAFIDLSAHPDPESIFVSLTSDFLLKSDVDVHLGAGRTKWIAELATHIPNKGLSVRDPEAFLAPLPVDCLTPVSPQARERLQFLGYSDTQDVRKVRLATLKRQFGSEAQAIFDAVRGGMFEPVQPLYPERGIMIAKQFEPAVECLETFGNALSELAKRIALKLSKLDAVGFALEVEITDAEGTNRNLSRTFVKPLHTRMSVHAALVTLLKGAELRTVSRVIIRLPEIKKQRMVQGNLSNLGEGSVDDNASELAISRVQRVFGEGAVVRGTDITTPRHVQFLRRWEKSLGHP